jgi:hypothetical protein
MHIRAAIAAVPLLALIACSASPEDVSSSSSALEVSGGCPMGRCNTPLFPTCNFVVPAPQSGEAVFVESWSVITADGQCPQIPGNGGYWANLWSVPSPSTLPPFDGIPSDHDWHAFSCNQILDTDHACCAYVWWPDGFPTAATWAPQDTGALCTFKNPRLVAQTKLDCPDSVPPYLPLDHRCPQPGNGGCTTCTVKLGP